jgi:hypothetical protein
VAADPDRDGLLITAYEPGRLWTEADYSSRSELHRLGERLQVLHAVEAPPVAAFDPWAIAQSYLEAIRHRDAPLELPEAQLHRLEGACAEVRGAGISRCIAHGDLAQNNLLDGARLWLLDWEYAQRSDPFMDIACVLAYYPQSARLTAELAAAAGLRAERTILAPRLYIYRALSWLWHLARGERASPPAA